MKKHLVFSFAFHAKEFDLLDEYFVTLDSMLSFSLDWFSTRIYIHATDDWVN